MSTGRKIWLIILVMVFTAGNFVLLLAVWPGVLDMVSIAQADPALSGNHAADFAFYGAAVSAAPWWLYIVPFIAGIIEVFVVLAVGPVVMSSVRAKLGIQE